MSGLLSDLLYLWEEAEAHQHEEASPSGPVLSLQGNEAVLWCHLQLQIHRLSCPPWKPEVTPIRLMCKVMPQREAATAPSSKLEESLQSLPWFEPTLKIHSPSLILVPNMKTIFVWRNKHCTLKVEIPECIHTLWNQKWKWWGACLLYTVDWVCYSTAVIQCSPIQTDGRISKLLQASSFF